VQGTKDGGKTWTNLTAKLTGIPPMTYVSTVLASKYAVNRVYATFDGHYSDDYKPYVLVSDDYGLTWRSIVTGLPETSINRIREHPSDPNFLVLGHEKGVHFSTDAGKNWMPLSQVTNLPNAPTDDIVIHPRDNALVLGTHGRGIIILDDIGPLQLMKPETLASDAALAPIAPAHGIITHNVQAWYGAGHFFAPNADVGAGINYYLRDGASGSVEIVISDASGKKVRTLSGGTMKGINHTSWDLRADPPAAVPGAPAAPGGGRGGGGGGGGGGGSQGALVSPGTYTVVVTIPGIARQLRGTVTVDSDPIATAKR
jgi:hypothetical protein